MFALVFGLPGCVRHQVNKSSGIMKLPTPKLDSQFSLEKAISLRRSIRGYSEAPLSLGQLSQLLWAAQGITSPEGLRASPSAGATYPLELYVAAGRVSGLEPGIYHYTNQAHELTSTTEGDKRRELAQAALGQTIVGDAPASIIIAAVSARTSRRYGSRTARYVAMEAGHTAQNIYLQAIALGLGTVVVGAFTDDEVTRVAGLGEAEPLYIMPVGVQEII
jgi:SagB-type dehydrogenase family enzyme